MRLVTAVFIGVLVGVTVAVVVNAIEGGDLVWTRELLLGPFGLFFGSFSAVLAFGLALAWRYRDATGAKVGWAIAALALALLGSLVVMYIVGWRMTPWSLEGAWIYPLAAAPLFSAAYVTGRIRARAGWVVAAMVLGLFSVLIASWAFSLRFPPQSIEGLVAYLMTAVVLAAAALAAYSAVGAERGTRFGPLRGSRAASIIKPSRVSSGLWVALAILIAFLLREPIYAAFTLRAEFNLVGLWALATWSIVVVAAVVAVFRARSRDPMFRGVYSEILRIVAVLQALVAVAMWVVVINSGAYT